MPRKLPGTPDLIALVDPIARRLVGSIQLHFDSVPDPRRAHGRSWDLTTVLTIALLASLCGAEGWDQIELFAQMRSDWLREIVPGIPPDGRTPSDSTFERVFKALRPHAFVEAFNAWLFAVIGRLPERHIALDGKALRRAFEEGAKGHPLHLLHAFEVDRHVLLGQVRIADKSNEIPAAPPLLKALDLRGATVTADAMHCQHTTVETIVDGDGDYLVAVKDNQPGLHGAVEATFDLQRGRGGRVVQTSERSRGREETRRTTVRPVPRGRPWVGAWKGVQSVVEVERTTTSKSGTREERAFYISSLPAPQAARIAQLARDHWKVETTLHWTLDMTFREDESRVRNGHAAENLSFLRKAVLGMLKRATGMKGSLRMRQKMCAWEPSNLLRVFAAQIPDSPGDVVS